MCLCMGFTALESIRSKATVYGVPMAHLTAIERVETVTETRLPLGPELKSVADIVHDA
jgi:hypothetical protein